MSRTIEQRAELRTRRTISSCRSQRLLMKKRMSRPTNVTLMTLRKTTKTSSWSRKKTMKKMFKWTKVIRMMMTTKHNKHKRSIGPQSIPISLLVILT